MSMLGGGGRVDAEPRRAEGKEDHEAAAEDQKRNSAHEKGWCLCLGGAVTRGTFCCRPAASILTVTSVQLRSFQGKRLAGPILGCFPLTSWFCVK